MGRAIDFMLADRVNIAAALTAYVAAGPNVQYDAQAVVNDMSMK